MKEIYLFTFRTWSDSTEERTKKLFMNLSGLKDLKTIDMDNSDILQTNKFKIRIEAKSEIDSLLKKIDQEALYQECIVSDFEIERKIK